MIKNARYAVRTRALSLAVLCWGVSAVSCLDSLKPGQWGPFRLTSVAQGDQLPLSLSPPTSDRAGNIYTLYGELLIARAKGHVPNATVAYVTQASGGERDLCQLTGKNTDYGPHGWVGFSQDQSWYWSSDWLIAVSGKTGGCSPVLDKDTRTRLSDLHMLGVIPWVRDSPSRTTLVALVKTDLDKLPYFVLVDLRSALYTDPQTFEPADATDVKVLGVGADPDNNLAFMLIHYQRGNTTYVEAIFRDFDSNQIARVPVSHAESILEYGIQGYLQTDDKGDIAGLTDDGKLVVFNRSGGTVHSISSSMTPVGVHRWHGALWLVGQKGHRPVLAPIRSGVVVESELQVWASSESAISALQGAITVIDDRAIPKEISTWNTPQNAIGAFPFLSPYSPNEYASNATLWVVAGPAFGQTRGVMEYFIAVAPVGISYP